jgi:hypothetical protein
MCLKILIDSLHFQFAVTNLFLACFSEWKSVLSTVYCDNSSLPSGSVSYLFQIFGSGCAKPVQISSSTSILENKISNKIIRCLKLTKNGLNFKYFIKREKNRSQGSIISIVNRVCAGRSWQWEVFFFFSTVSKSSLHPTQPAIQWVLGALSRR